MIQNRPLSEQTAAEAEAAELARVVSYVRAVAESYERLGAEELAKRFRMLAMGLELLAHRGDGIPPAQRVEAVLRIMGVGDPKE